MASTPRLLAVLPGSRGGGGPWHGLAGGDAPPRRLKAWLGRRRTGSRQRRLFLSGNWNPFGRKERTFSLREVFNKLPGFKGICKAA
jgi:hypothetical protein